MKFRGNPRVLAAAFLIVISLVLGVGVVTAGTGCETYYDSRISYFQQNGICYSSGHACTVCWNTETGSTCVTNGASCQPSENY